MPIRSRSLGPLLAACLLALGGYAAGRWHGAITAGRSLPQPTIERGDVALDSASSAGGAPTARELATLRADLESARRAEGHWRRVAERLTQGTALSGEPAQGGALDPGESRSSETSPRRSMRRASTLRRLDSADAELAGAIAARDPEGLLHLFGDLLRFGRPGYDKLISTVASMRESDATPPPWELWQEIEDAYLGVALRVLIENDEEVLRFCLYLVEQPPAQLPEPLQDFRAVFPQFAPTLLGLLGDRNPELLLDTIAIVRAYYLDGDLRESDSLVGAVHALAQIHLEESTDMLLGLLERAPIESLPVIIDALAIQGNPRALPPIQSLEAQFTEPPLLVDRIQWAIQRLARE